VPGGSTLATQIEKYRHSPDGQTVDATEKLRQMASASLRAYMNGSNTIEARRRLVVDYLNSTPLAGRPGFGEVIGLGDGLWAWYGTGLEAASSVLRKPALGERDLARQAQVYKQVLSLLLAQRRPAFYLSRDREALRRLTDSYLRLLETAGVIDHSLRNTALRLPLSLAEVPPTAAATSFVDEKAASAVRTGLLSLLGISSLYRLDRLDLTVETTFDAPTQKRVTDVLHRLGDRSYLTSLGLSGTKLVGPGDPAKIVYSFALYERGTRSNYLRVQADNLDQPFDLNEGSMLDLGSTAKLRTLISYLEIVAALHDRYAHLTDKELGGAAHEVTDPLTRWAVRHLSSTRERSLKALLETALLRRYSASPDERFFTGGGVHTFANFGAADDVRVISVAEAFRRSVNLVFVRLMRDIVRYHIAEGQPHARDLLKDGRHPARREYLARFADLEGRESLNRFYGTYRGLSPPRMLRVLGSRARATADSLAVVFRSIQPEATAEDLAEFLCVALPKASCKKAIPANLHDKSAPDRLSLADRSTITRVHPLELWLAGFLAVHPDATRVEILAASKAQRQMAYDWLFRTKSRRAQDRRIRQVLEVDAFRRIHRSWQKLGYPFESLVPSYATAIGSSADRPTALAELMGILVNDGLRLPTVRIQHLHFASATPYETVMNREPTLGPSVLAPEVAAIARALLIEVVAQGTGRRARGAFSDPVGQELKVGGKTGTGDHRFEHYGADGRLIRSAVISRTATFVFFIGDRFFGTITAFVEGSEAAKYGFTSALATQLLKALAPAIRPLLDGGQPVATAAVR
jgi:membrane peptidoglycan carboxypeptidase